MTQRISQYRLAMGLSYNERKDQCPRVTLRAEELLADRVVRMARKHKIPVVEKPELAQALLDLQLDARIPEELFNAVALVFAEIERL